MKPVATQPIDHRRKMLDGNILTPAECLRLYAAAIPGRDRVLFRTAVETAMRQGELLGLQWGDVELDTGRIFVRSSCRKRKASLLKTAAAFRTITIKTELLPELRRWKLACPAAPEGSGLDLVFPNGAGGYEDAHNLLNRHFRPALRRAGLRAIRFHDLRHTCASLMLRANVPIKVVQTHLGHASAQITLDAYGHLMPGDSALGADAFASAFGEYKVRNRGINDDRNLETNTRLAAVAGAGKSA